MPAPTSRSGERSAGLSEQRCARSPSRRARSRLNDRKAEQIGVKRSRLGADRSIRPAHSRARARRARTARARRALDIWRRPASARRARSPKARPGFPPPAPSRRADAARRRPSSPTMKATTSDGPAAVLAAMQPTATTAAKWSRPMIGWPRPDSMPSPKVAGVRPPMGDGQRHQWPLTRQGHQD